MKSCSSCDRYVVESGDSTWTLTLMFGLAFSKALIAVCVCWPSVPSPDSANTMVCVALAATEELDPPPELQAAAPAAQRDRADANRDGTPARRSLSTHAIPPHYGE